MTRYSTFAGFLILMGVGLSASASAAQERAVCEGGADPQGVIVALDGAVELREPSGRTVAASVGAVLCARDQITTGTRSRIEFRLTGRNTTTGSSSNSVTVIPSSQSECVELRSGLMSFISSVIGSHCVSTPLIDAGIDGTEALIAVDGPTGDSFVLVQEGIVSVRDRRASGGQNGQFKLIAASDDLQNAAFATQEQTLTRATPENTPPKFRELLLKPADATDWAIHYPPILFAAGVTDPSLREAAALLDAGETSAANALLSEGALAGRDKAAALSLQSIAAIYKNQTDLGRALADEAVATDPGLGAAHIAQSYAYQATGQLDDARASAEAAVEMEPTDAYAWARLAELHLTLGARGDARDAVERSLTITETAHGRTIEGFVELSINDFDAADAALRRAIEIDSEAPLPRLGLGLKEIREGNIEAGRLEMETAVALDPKRASLRTWLGRAYYEERRGKKASAQFGIARDQDPDDPTAYLFSALQNYSDNRPILALRDINEARLRGGARSVVRGTRGLGEDRATSGSATGRIYDTLGLEVLAVNEGSRAVSDDRSNPDAHLFLADVLGRTNASETARTSENLQATLLAPPSKAPGDILKSEADLTLLEGSGATRLTFSEFSPAFNSNGPALYATGIFGTQQTFGEEVSGAFLHDNFSINASQLYFSTDGFRANNDLEHRVYQVQTKFQPVPWLTLFGEGRRRESEVGDRQLDFDITSFDPTRVSKFDRDTLRFGVLAEIDNKQDLLGLFTYANLETFDESTDPFGSTFSDLTEENSYDAQLQHIGRFGKIRTVVGGNYAVIDSTGFSSISDPFFGTFAFPQVSNDAEQGNVYGYANVTYPANVRWTAGLSFDYYEDKPFDEPDRRQVNPKLGVEVDITDGLTARAAYVRSLSKRLVSEQSLEPTTVAGFNQFEDTLNSVAMERVGLGVDAVIGEDVKLGVEATVSWFEFPVPFLGEKETREREAKAYVGVALSDDLYLTLDASHEQIDSTFFAEFRDYEVTTTRAGLKYFHPSGFFAAAEVEGVRGDFLTQGGAEGDDTFALVNGSLGYRLPNQRGVLSIEVQNLFDTDFNFQERNIRNDIISNPRFPRELTVFGKAVLKF